MLDIHNIRSVLNRSVLPCSHTNCVVLNLFTWPCFCYASGVSSSESDDVDYESHSEFLILRDFVGWRIAATRVWSQSVASMGIYSGTTGLYIWSAEYVGASSVPTLYYLCHWTLRISYLKPLVMGCIGSWPMTSMLWSANQALSDDIWAAWIGLFWDELWHGEFPLYKIWLILGLHLKTTKTGSMAL